MQSSGAIQILNTSNAKHLNDVRKFNQRIFEVANTKA